MTFIRLFTVLACAALLSACATTAPEDMPRAVDFRWDLKPEYTPGDTQTVMQGEIALQWEASADATHETIKDGQRLPLLLARTSRGNLYCASRDMGDKCYEDRDSDSMLDYAWTPYRGDKTISAYRVVSSAEPLEVPLPLQITDNTETIMQHTLGLLYDGPVRGLLNDAGEFDIMLGMFELGWFNGRGSERSPTGTGWSKMNILPLVIVKKDEKNDVPEITFEALGLRYALRKAFVDGSLTLSIEADPVQDVDLGQDFDLDIEKLPDMDDVTGTQST